MTTDDIGLPLGSHPGAQWLRGLVRRVWRATPIESPDISIQQTPLGTRMFIRQPGARRGAGNALTRFRIIEILDAHLVCRRVQDDGTTAAEADTLVARPAELQFDDATTLTGWSTVWESSQSRRLTRIADGFTFSESIYPAYLVGQDIFAAKPNGKTNVTPAGGSQIEWVDINSDGRHWRMDLVEIKVCINNVLRRMLVPGTNPL